MKKKKYIQGFSLVSAIFILVVLSLIGIYIVRLGSLTRATNNLTLLGVRAYFAAKSGVEWGIYQAVTINAGAACPSSPTTINFTQAGLNGYNAVVTCVMMSVTEGPLSYNIFTITAQGSLGTLGGLDYVSRNAVAVVIK